MKRFDRDAAQIIDVPAVKSDLPPGVGQIDRAVPTRAPEVSGDVLVPLLRAVVSGGFLFVIVGVLVIVWDWLPWYAAVLVGGTAAAVVWFWHGLSNALLWATETITGTDLDRDGQVGRPRIDIVVEQPFTNNERRLPDLPCTPDQLQAFALGITYEGKTLSIGQWTGRGKAFRRGEYEEFIAEMHRRGIVVWKDEKNTNLGREFTVYGRGVFRQVAEQVRAGVHVHERVAQLEAPADGVGGYGE